MKQLCILLCSCILLSCTKESEKEYCWQGFDPNGYTVQGLEVCGKTAAEVQAEYPQYWFYKADEPTYCWKVEVPARGPSYMRRVPVSMMDKMMARLGYSYAKVSCTSFCTWQYLDRARSKSDGGYAPIRTSRETYAADSCSKLYQGRIITLRETADTLYTREFWKQDP
jgi:hypothetical protein